jgi:hypothetical protein
MKSYKTFNYDEKRKIARIMLEQERLQGQLDREIKQAAEEPSLATKAVTLTTSLANWAAKGFKVVEPEQFQARLDICKGCEYWDSKAMFGTGKCRKCGCSTQAKLRLATSTCPVGKW